MTTTSPEQNKALVLKAFDTLFNKRDYIAAESFWSDRYIQQAPISRRAAMACSILFGTSRYARCENHVILAEGDYVIAHGRFSGHGRPGHGSPPTSCVSKTASSPSTGTFFRTRPPKRNPVSGLPMFGDRFPA